MSLTIAQFADSASENFVKSLSIFCPTRRVLGAGGFRCRVRWEVIEDKFLKPPVRFPPISAVRVLWVYGLVGSGRGGQKVGHLTEALHAACKNGR